MLQSMIRPVLIIGTLALAYWFWLRPILMSKPTFKEYLQEADTHLEAITGKLHGIKQKLAGSGMVVIGLVIEIYDDIAPAFGAVDTTKLTSYVPEWAWPLVVIGGVGMLNYFRKLNDKAHAEELAAVTAANNANGAG